jgi:hypothetical protein
VAFTLKHIPYTEMNMHSGISLIVAYSDVRAVQSLVQIQEFAVFEYGIVSHPATIHPRHNRTKSRSSEGCLGRHESK